MSQSVSPLQGGTSSRMPYGTDLFCFCALLFFADGLQEAEDPPDEQSSLHNIERGIVVSIQHDTAGRTDMGTHAQAFLDHCATLRTVLRGEGRLDRDARDIVHRGIVLHPLQELAPTGVIDRFGKAAIACHIGYFQILEGNQIARCDKRVCRFSGKVFTLPTHLQIALS